MTYTTYKYYVSSTHECVVAPNRIRDRYFTVQIGPEPILRSTPSTLLGHSITTTTTMLSRSSRRSATTCLRQFSDYPGRGGRFGGRGGRGRGGGRGQGGRGAYGPTDGKFHRGGPPKENFARKFLDPAARGELFGKHDAGIPRLAARKGKGHQLRDQFPGTDADEDLDLHFLNASANELEASMSPEQESSGIMNGENLAAVNNILYPGFVDDEDEYDDIDTDGFDPDNHPNVYRDAGGNVVLQYDPLNPFHVAASGDGEDDSVLDDSAYHDDGGEDDGGYGDDYVDDDLSQLEDVVDEFGLDVDVVDNLGFDIGVVDDLNPAPSGRGKVEKNVFVDPEELYFDRDYFDFEAPQPGMNVPREIANSLLPLRVEGDGLDDFLEANYNHPSKYAEVRRYNLHPESRREAKPFFPKNRVQPPIEFVTSHMRFIFLSGLPHHVEPDGTLGEMENPTHRFEVSKMVSELLGMPTQSICPASMTSAFVGFTTKEQFYQFMVEGPTYNTLERELKMSIYNPEESEANCFEAGDVVIKIDDVPADMTMARFAHALFPAGTELGEIYGPVSVDDLKKVGTCTVLVRMKSEEQAGSALSSSLVQDHMVNLGTSIVQFFRARRQLVFGGFTGPNKGQTFKKRGNMLTVDVDSPSKAFLQSHAAVVQLANVDKAFTKEHISKFIEPFSADRRDVIGSIEFALCLQKERTHIVYVGFDRPGEAEAFIKGCSGLIHLGKGPITVRLVKEQWNPTTALPRETRPSRSGEDILASLDNWETFVDMKQVEALEALGVNRDILADAFRTMRFQNLSYGVMDWGMTREKLDPTKSDPGQHMRETMQLYIETLLEIASSKEILPGKSLEEIMTLPDDEQEEGDFSGEGILEDDRKRVAMIAVQRNSYFFDK